MDLEERLEIQQGMRNLNDHALLRLLALESEEFHREAISIAEDELASRGLRPLTRDEYFVKFPGEVISSSGFCEKCLSQTTDEVPNYGLFGGFGTRMLGAADECENCGSIVQTQWLWIIFPLRRIARYRLHYSRGAFMGLPSSYRKLKERDA
jgi:hypothetical protein